MTLVVGAQNNDYALQVSDRRLTGEDGSVVDEESNKLFIFESDACRFIVGFAGLALLSGGGGFVTNEWLCEALHDAGPPDFNPDGIVERLRVAATRRFNTGSVLLLKATVRRATIMMTGFVYTTRGPLPSYCMLTNFQDFKHGNDDDQPWPEFRAWWAILDHLDEPAWAVQRIGLWKLFGPQRTDPIVALVRDGRPPLAVVGKTVEVIRDIAGAPGSIGAVGRQIMSAVITPYGKPTSAYHSDIAQTTYYLPSIIISKGDTRLFARDLKLTAVGPDPIPLIYPSQRRNRLCACGSGKKFKLCHGRRT